MMRILSLQGDCMTIRYIIFDLDGTLLDSERPVREAWRFVLARKGVVLRDEDYALVVGRSERESESIIVNWLGAQGDVGALKIEVDAWLAARHPSFLPRPGVTRVLEELSHKGIPLAVASSTSIQGVHERLSAAQLSRYFQVLCGGDEVMRGKPAPDIFRLAADRLGADPSECLVFEDSDFGALAALAAKMRLVLIPDVKTIPHEIRSQAHAVLESFVGTSKQIASWVSAPER